MPNIETCVTCGQRNRVPDRLPPGKTVRCGRCQSPLLHDVDLDLDAEADALDAEGDQW